MLICSLSRNIFFCFTPLIELMNFKSFVLGILSYTSSRVSLSPLLRFSLAPFSLLSASDLAVSSVCGCYPHSPRPNDFSLTRTLSRPRPSACFVGRFEADAQARAAADSPLTRGRRGGHGVSLLLDLPLPLPRPPPPLFVMRMKTDGCTWQLRVCHLHSSAKSKL